MNDVWWLLLRCPPARSAPEDDGATMGGECMTGIRQPDSETSCVSCKIMIITSR